MDPDFASQLNSTCSSDPNAFAFLDPSPVGFDNAFYRNLQVGNGLLGSDQGAFFGDFVAAMTKLGRIGVKMPAIGGEIRQDCQFSN
ncbi:peroxidase 55-like [Miscanthus floridulus]|uniref:peroxidase 55-like n=1 Tax=Miscanthus floridulus TaxID=154761 RepID=UPI003459F100